MPRGIPKKRVRQKGHQRKEAPKDSLALLRLTVEFPATTQGLAEAKALADKATEWGSVIYAEVTGFKTIDLKF